MKNDIKRNDEMVKEVLTVEEVIDLLDNGKITSTKAKSLISEMIGRKVKVSGVGCQY